MSHHIEHDDGVTPERIAPASRRRVWVLVLGTLVFALVANFALLYLVRTHPTNGGHWLIRSKWELLDRAPTVDTLVLGDSTCNQGVRPDVWRETAHSSVLNLCTIGDMLVVNDAWMLEAYLRKHPTIRRVIVIHTFDTWQRDTDSRFAMLLGAVPLRVGFWRDFRVPVDLGVSGQALALAARWFPLYADESSLRMWVTQPRKTWKRHEGFQITSDGFEADPVARPEHVEVDHRLQKAALAEPWRPSHANARALDTIAHLAAEHGIEVTIAPGPLYEGLWRESEMQKRQVEIRAWLHSVLATSTVQILDDDPPVFAATEMTNADHITSDAAGRYTRWLVARVQQRE